MLDANNCVLLLNDLEEGGYVDAAATPPIAAATSSR